MKTVFEIALGIHILSILGILGLLLAQIKKSPRKLNPGVIHAGLSALVAGMVMTGMWKQVEDEDLNHAKVGVKLLVLLALLFLGYKNVKKDVLKNSVWVAMIGLTLLNVFIAVAI